MKIHNLNVIEFAALADRSFDICDGLNIIEGLNESGKSSLLAFIKFILYGFPRRTAGAELAERDRYISWSGLRAAGSMTFTAKQRRWRVEREVIIQTRGTRESAVESLKIIDADTGVEDHSGECPGELFLGIPAGVFSSTCSIGQLQSGEIDSAGVGSSIENLLFSADESLNAQKAAERLDAARKQLLHKNEKGGLLFDMRAERMTLRNRLSAAATAARNMIAKEALANDYKRRSDEARKALDSLESIHEISETLFALNKFDELRVLEVKRAEIERTLASLESDSFPSGFCPDRAYASNLLSLSSTLASDESALSRAESEHLKLESVQPYDQSKVDIAGFLRENASGSTESVLCSYRLLKEAILSAKRRNAALIVAGIIAALAGTALCFFLLIAGIATFAVGALTAILGVAGSSSVKQKEAALASYLSKLGVSSDPGENALREYIDSCFEAASAKAQYETALDARRGVCTVCRDKLASTRGECRAALALVGIDEEDERLPDALSEASVLAGSFCTARDELNARLESAKKDVDAVTSYLRQYDEPQLRQRAEAFPESEPLSSEEYKRRRTELMIEIKTSDDKKNDIEKQLAALDATVESPRRLSLQLEQNERKLEEMTLKYDAVKLAGEALADASGQLRRGVTPVLKNNAGALMSTLTSGRYSDLGIAQDMSVTVSVDGVTRPLAAMSGGTRDIAYISLRLALISLLCPDEKPPVLLDECFAQLDDVRAANLISMLTKWCAEGGQCLIFTCHSREAAIAGSAAGHVILNASPNNSR